MGKGIEIRAAHFPGRAPIDAYGNGGFRFADMSHKGSLLCIPSGIYGWAPTSIADINVASLERVLAEAAEISLLLMGTGDGLQPLPQDLRAVIRDAGISLEIMSTGAAVRTFNVLLAEERAVAAALIAVE